MRKIGAHFAILWAMGSHHNLIRHPLSWFVKIGWVRMDKKVPVSRDRWTTKRQKKDMIWNLPELNAIHRKYRSGGLSSNRKGL